MNEKATLVAALIAFSGLAYADYKDAVCEGDFWGRVAKLGQLALNLRMNGSDREEMFAKMEASGVLTRGKDSIAYRYAFDHASTKRWIPRMRT